MAILNLKCHPGEERLFSSARLARVNDYKSDLYGNLKTFLLDATDPMEYCQSFKRRSPGAGLDRHRGV